MGGEEAAKFFRKLMKRESLSCNTLTSDQTELFTIVHTGALTDSRLVVGITKFDLNYTSNHSQRRGSRSISVDVVRQSVVSSIKEATSVDVSEDNVLPLCSEWALTSIKLASSLVNEDNDIKKAKLQEALSSLEKYPHHDSLPRGQGERLTEVNYDPHKVIECLDKASGIHDLKKWYTLL